MDKLYDIQVKVISQKGECGAEHKVGDSWIIGSKTQEGICLPALNAILPDLRVLRFGGELPWAQDKDTATVACPDAENPVVFELRRLH
ncbi:MAG: TIGR04076 family protein [Chloroflexi bacterium]|nr:TIGR04076 family protein [Chloroflexota bacterium]